MSGKDFEPDGTHSSEVFDSEKASEKAAELEKADRDEYASRSRDHKAYIAALDAIYGALDGVSVDDAEYAVLRKAIRAGYEAALPYEGDAYHVVVSAWYSITHGQNAIDVHPLSKAGEDILILLDVLAEHIYEG